MNPVFSEYGLKDLLPLKLDVPDEGCTRPNESMFCFEAGELSHVFSLTDWCKFASKVVHRSKPKYQ